MRIIHKNLIKDLKCHITNNYNYNLSFEFFKEITRYIYDYFSIEIIKYLNIINIPREKEDDKLFYNNK